MTRVISGAVLIALTVALVWFASPLAFESFAIVVGLLAVWELVRLVRVAPAILIALVYIALPLAALVQIRLIAGPEAVFLVMLRTYRGLLDEIVRRDYDVFSARVRLSSWHKLWLTARALPARLGWG